jgi:uncharacterized protein (TIGR02217 family)
MSTAVFAPPPGTGWPVTRTPVFDTVVQQAISGKETRIARQTYPRWKWELTMNVLRSGAAYSSTEFQYLAGFFEQRLGQFDTFLYQDPDDNSVTGQPIGTGNGATSFFQLVRSFGGFVEPVLAPNAVSAIYLNSVSIPQAGYSAPTSGALTQTSGGSLGVTTYYVKSTWITNSGETLPSAETNLAVSASHVLNVAAPGSAPAGAIGWNVYVSNTSGGSGAETLQNGGTPIAVGTPWVEPISGLVTGAALPASNSTNWGPYAWGSSYPGQVQFGGNVGNGVAIAADFTYYWPCRMSDDSLPFELFLSGMYSAKKFSFISVKN